MSRWFSRCALVFLLTGAVSAQVQLTSGVKVNPGVRMSKAEMSQQLPALAQPIVFGGTGATFTQDNKAGNLIVVIPGWYGSSANLDSPAVTDGAGNTYEEGCAANTTSDNSIPRQAIYYAKNIAAYTANAVTVHWAATPGSPGVRILEFSGLDRTSPFDACSAVVGTYTGNVQTTVATNAVTTATATELLVGGGTTTWAFAAPGVNYQGQMRSGGSDLAEYRVVQATGSYAADGVLTAHSQNWIMSLATFKAAGQIIVQPPPTLTSVTPNSGSTAGGTSVTLAGTNFAGNVAVDFGGAAASSVNLASSTSITAATPTHAAGVVNVTVTVPGAPPATLSGAFTYTAPPVSTDRYISPSGNNANTGVDASHPWQTIAYAAANVPAGGTIHAAAGSYAPAVLDCSSGARQGTSANPITLIAEPERGAVIQGSAGYPLGLKNCAYWTVQGFVVKDADYTGTGMYHDGNIYVYYGDHVTLRRNLVAYTDRYYNSAAFQIDYSNNTVVEENELYSFHKHGIVFYYGATTARNIARRNYCNSRNYADIAGGFVSDNTTRGDQCVLIYGESGDLLENNVSEGQMWGFGVQPAGTARADNTLFYGNISVSDVQGFHIEANSGSGTQTQDDAHMPHGTLFVDNVGISGYETTAEFSLESAKTSSLDRNTAITVQGQTGFQFIRHAENGGDGSYSAHLDRGLAVQTSGGAQGNGFYGYATSGTLTMSGDKIAAENWATPFTGMTGVTNQNTLAANGSGIAGCKVWRPDGSWAKTNNVGADILYRYESGALSTTPLWNDAGDFPQGAIVAGLNDVGGSSLTNLKNRLHIGSTLGCAYPAGYGSGNPTHSITQTVSGVGTVVSLGSDGTPDGRLNCGNGNTQCVASYNAGSSVHLRATAGTNYTFTPGWGGDGTCSGTTADCTFTLDSDRSLTAQFTLNSFGGPYSVTNQQPVTTVFYPNTLWTKQLPGDILFKLAPNSDAIVRHMFNNSDQANNGAVVMPTMDPALTPVSQGGFYYAGCSDPLFRINAGAVPHIPSGVNATSANDPNGKYFHMPSGAKYDALADDQALMVWDQCNDTDPSPGGRIFKTYHYTSTNQIRALPTTCACTTKACTDSTAACQLGYPVDNYGEVGYPFTDPHGWDNGGTFSDGAAPGVYFLREQEIMQNTVKHALGLNTVCVRANNAHEFPALSTWGPLACSPSDSLRPVAGDHFFIDQAYNCDAQVSGAFVLPGWQRPICHALQDYGGYLHDTSGPASGSGPALTLNPMEMGNHYFLKGLQDPFFYTWIMNTANTGSLTTVSDGSGWSYYGGPWVGSQPAFKMVVSGGHATKLGFYLQMPGLITGQGAAANNDGKLHLHIADPCVARALDGQTVAQGACP